MADRIFPSAEQDSLGSTKQINTIDWEKFAQTFNKRVAEDNSDKELSDDMKTLCDKLGCEKTKQALMDSCKEVVNGSDEKVPEGVTKQECRNALKELESEGSEGSEVTSKTAGKMPKGLLEYFKKKKKKNGDSDSEEEDDEEEEEEEEEDEEKEEEDDEEEDKKPKHKHEDKKPDMKREGDKVQCKTCGKTYAYGGSCSACSASKRASSRKIVFNSPAEISAEALQGAKTAGDEQLYRAILAARQDRNKVIESRLERLAHLETEKNQKLAQRRAYRAQIIAETEASAKRLASAEATVANDTQEFKKVSSMKNDEKKIVAQRLLDNGFPAEYVEAALGMYSETPVSDEETQIREIMSSSLNSNTKRTAVAGLVKTAKLSQEQLNRCIRFWVDELGYGDEEWVRDLFSNK